MQSSCGCGSVQLQPIQVTTTQCQPACQQSCSQLCATSSLSSCQQSCQVSCQSSCAPQYQPVVQCQPSCQSVCQQSCVAQQQPVAYCNNQCQSQCASACGEQQTVAVQFNVQQQCQPACQQQCQMGCVAQPSPVACSSQCQTQCSSMCGGSDLPPITYESQCAPACQPSCQPSCIQQQQQVVLRQETTACMPQCQMQCQASCATQQSPVAPLLGRLPNLLLSDLRVRRATMCPILHAGLRTDMRRPAARLHATVSAAVCPAEYAVSAVPDRLSSPAAANRPGDHADQHRSIHPVPTSVRVQLRQSMHPAESTASVVPAGLRPELPTILCPTHSDGMPVRSSAVPMPNRILAMW
ncbi:cysteine rich repeat-containing domain protein [Ancylostoma duodenale]|uniref:Cysteine rich repeat-containing domain protein n=1 Tax=Ancylostoma duodenale TaxID=51022 RepID=A0A0C2FFM1_9BILA|nr:cysteine rich repeat-containing domain protein [Ancylostoma duodenale]